MKENSIEEDIKILKELGQKYYKNGEIKIKALSGAKYIWALQNLLSDYKRVLKENELLRKDMEGWKKYCEEIEEEQTEISNKNCKLEFEIEKLQKENEDLHREINQRIKLKIENEKIVDTQFIPVQKVKDKIEELKKNLYTVEHYETVGAINVLQELLEGRK